ncbi:unnamed protein product (macronuclear) [Paramecium tetraurelia]|uniref:Phosphatidylinositol-4-phosphate 5-kinase n=1 Tax=Paramecium tetraurelia TaxID=5888 RepID=A0CJH7_PARTE|nr:uncharacterized protein GSPATT00000655001 [Paramecium tetraurelia]CAK70944.1 unnamed protein product [Paramecium tetraurelia]|eukprot:XP_001438341.1 hypothetical protein (macronuclear) [Paramecium tetraurelia strain d4-2]
MDCLKFRKEKLYQQTLLNTNETRFSDKELNVLRKRFIQMTNGCKNINQEQFKSNLDVLGLESISCLGDALFQAMDINLDGHIEFEEFVAYFDKITYGTQEEKAEISFRIIDQRRNGYITYKDFSFCMQQLIKSYTIMKGTDLTDDILDHMEKRQQQIFNLIDINKDQKISLQEYIIALTRNPQVLDIFEFLRKGVTQTIKESQHKRDQKMLNQFDQLRAQTALILNSVHGQQDRSLHLSKHLSQNSKYGVDVLFDEAEISESVSEIDEMSMIDQMSHDQLKLKFKEMYSQLQKLHQDTENSLNKMESLYHEKLECDEIQEQILIKQVSINNNKYKKSSVQIGNEIWDLVINMMVGIQMAVKSSNAVVETFISTADFDIKQCFELISHQNKDKCKFYDYAPKVFNQIRRLQMIDNDNYLNSIGPENLLFSFMQGDLSTLTELTSTGKSGSFFYFSQDGLYTIKTISEKEFLLFRKILSNYFYYLKNCPNSLIIKLYGLHKISINGRKIFFIVMGNVFKTEFQIHKKYDLKGSTYKRTTQQNLDPDVARKDLDFMANNEIISIDPKKQQELLEQIEKDSEFLSDNNLLDYSLLIGIHIIEDKKDIQMIANANDIKIIKSNDQTKIFFFGIIDILTEFDTSKQMESFFKKIFQGPQISAIPPKDYSQRFKNFMSQILTQQNFY